MSVAIEQTWNRWMPILGGRADANLNFKSHSEIHVPQLNPLTGALDKTNRAWNKNGPRAVARELRTGFVARVEKLVDGLRQFGLSHRIVGGQIESAARGLGVEDVRLLLPVLSMLVFLLVVYSMVQLYSTTLIHDLSRDAPNSKLLIFFSVLAGLAALAQWMRYCMSQRVSLEDQSQRVTLESEELRAEIAFL
jgi:hypothetical protein